MPKEIFVGLLTWEGGLSDSSAPTGVPCLTVPYCALGLTPWEACSSLKGNRVGEEKREPKEVEAVVIGAYCMRGE